LVFPHRPFSTPKLPSGSSVKRSDFRSSLEWSQWQRRTPIRGFC
jgi:hypothetical protein